MTKSSSSEVSTLYYLSSMWVIRIIAFKLLCDVVPTNGWAFGTGSCMSGGAAVGSTHILPLDGLRTIDGKSLSLDFPNITITMNNRTIDVSGTRPNILLRADTVYEWKITSTQRNMKGIFMRMEVLQGINGTITNVTDFLVRNRNTRNAGVCDRSYGTSVEGITHWNPFRKNVYSGLVKLTEATHNVLFEITMVVTNGLFRSEFAYGEFKATFGKLLKDDRSDVMDLESIP
jgi:hypothetical protein